MSRRPIAPARRVLIDTSAYYALADQDELYHQQAREVAKLLARRRAHLFTTTYVVAGTHALLVNRLDRSLAFTCVRQIYGSATTVVRVSQRDEDRAWAIIEQFDDKDLPRSHMCVSKVLRLRGNYFSNVWQST